jgi:hypothetical protein
MQQKENEKQAICCNVPGGIFQESTGAVVSLAPVANAKGNKEVKEIC